MSIKDEDTIYRFGDFVFIPAKYEDSGGGKGYSKYLFEDCNGVPVLDFVKCTKNKPLHSRETTLRELGF